MTQDKAKAWLQQVNGRIYHSRTSEREAWVAVVQTPRAGLRNGKLIIALGGTLEEATTAAQGQWESLWSELSRSH